MTAFGTLPLQSHQIIHKRKQTKTIYLYLIHSSLYGSSRRLAPRNELTKFIPVSILKNSLKLAEKVSIMKIKLLTLLIVSLLWGYTMRAQLTITPGSQFSTAGQILLTLKNTDLVNNGNFIIGNSIISFTGNNSSSVSGTQPIQFFKLDINKTNNASVILERSIGVVDHVLFLSGFLDLNGFNADLGSTGSLLNETEDSRVTGINGGQVQLTTILNRPVDANPGNLGVVISSAENLGLTIIARGHQAMAVSGLADNSILRYYDIFPATNANLNAELKFNYFDGELNGIDENTLAFFKTEDGVNWSNQGLNSRNTTTNFATKTGINSFSRWTLSGGLDSPLPVLFVLFNAKCAGSTVLITWETAQEQNTSRFDIERNSDGSHWTVIGTLAASGTSVNERSYSFKDNSPVQNALYRVVEYDLDGNSHYTSIISSPCNAMDLFSLWPNPIHNRIFINITSSSQSQAIIKVFDSKGALLKIHKENVVPGSNQLSVDVVSLPRGAYSLSAEWNNGQMKKTVQIIKQ
jgi:type IX secretion system substrate protein